ncbi:MAG: GNAT family N-acetyltransferase [Marinobacter sp.]|nr:GNAT family N-acetyltransferase [Marinobacter sp.]
MFHIRPLQAADWPAVWAFMAPVFRAGETYAFDPAITEAEAHQVWVGTPLATLVAEDAQGQIIGTYYLKANQPGLGSHVCNCGYLVAESARGQGVAAALCEHSQQLAVAQGFRAMQFNLVVATNTGAVRLWQKLGFEIAGSLPGAFHHRRLGYVDAHVMYKSLV